MTETLNLYWLAGLLEGEGSFMKPTPSLPNRPVISVQMTDEDVISRVANILGCSYYHVPSKNPKWKDTFCIRVRGKKAVSWMNELRPLMGNRRQQQIDVALAHYNPNKRQEYYDRCAHLRKLNYKTVIEAAKNIEAGNSLRSQARKIGVHHESLRREIEKRSRRGSNPQPSP
jgi:hypothetical protein